jgi:drug/metabolite transporter (DMT)-like permease
MTFYALALVLAAAFIHACWNLLAKKTFGGVAFTWLFSAGVAVIYLPLAIALFVIKQPYFPWTAIAIVTASSIFHTAYFLLLTLGYRKGDLSIVYPLARCSGPLLSVTAAVIILGERPSLTSLSGCVAIALGVFVLLGNLQKLLRSDARAAVICALLAGTSTAAYTIFDKYAVSLYLIPPILLQYLVNIGRLAVLTPFALRNWDQVRRQWRQYPRQVIGVAILAPLAYILFLMALVFSPVSYVAPAREISILIGTLMGARLLAEGHTARRIIGAAVMMAGLAALAVG